MGSAVSEATAKLFEEDRYQDYLLLHGLGVEMAEALAAAKVASAKAGEQTAGLKKQLAEAKARIAEVTKQLEEAQKKMEEKQEQEEAEEPPPDKP